MTSRSVTHRSRHCMVAGGRRWRSRDEVVAPVESVLAKGVTKRSYPGVEEVTKFVAVTQTDVTDTDR